MIADRAPACNRWLRRASVWVPTWRTLLLLLAAGALVLWGALRSAHRFLSVHEPVAANVLVVEGWLPDDALAVGVREFQRGGYEVLIASGGPLPKGYLVSGYATYAELAGATVVKLGVATNQLRVASTAKTHRNRTYVSACAVRDLVREHGLTVRGINVVSEGPHARRTRLAYRKAFGDSTAIGILDVPPQDYDADRWWASSDGVKSTLTEGLGWLYEVLFDSGR